ncbi:MAG: hypothetical protein JXR94_14035 [Candidatus Hydrogenedentes bacterium]|nr:hypothetical protein [Candidatus Hydrogenedentota bacterium]
MRYVTAGLVVLVLVTGCAVDDGTSLLDQATEDAFAQFLAAVENAPKAGNIKRIGVAYLDGDTGTMTDLLQIYATKSRFDIVLTSDEDCGPLLEEWARQAKRDYIIDPDTAHALAAHGVDAVLHGTVEAKVEDVKGALFSGKRATVKLMLKLGSVSEENPGHLVWGEDIRAVRDERSPGDLFIEQLYKNKVLVIAVGCVLVLFVLFLLYRMAVRPR